MKNEFCDAISVLLEFIVAFCQKKLICELNNIFSSAFITIMFVGDDGETIGGEQMKEILCFSCKKKNIEWS